MRGRKAISGRGIVRAESEVRASIIYLGSKEGSREMRSERTASGVNASTGSLGFILLAVGSNGRVLRRGMGWAEVSFRKTTPVLGGLVRECWAPDLKICIGIILQGIIFKRYNFILFKKLRYYYFLLACN